jgi:uncharacterized membrane protein
MKSVDVKTETTIAVSVEKVSEYSSNPDNATDWYENIKSVKWETAKPLAVGSRIIFTAQFMGRRLQYTYEITEFKPGKKLVMETSDGPFPMKTAYTWEKTEDGYTRMILQNTGSVAGFSKWLTPFMERMMGKANTKDLQRLKQILEKQEKEK